MDDTLDILKPEKLDISQKRRVRVTHNIAPTTPITSVQLAKISHELRTFLNSITGIAQVLQYNKSLTQNEMNDYINSILETCNDLLNLSNDILDFTSLEHDQLNITTSDINLQETIEQTINQYILRAEHKKLTLNINYSPDAPLFVVGNAQRVRQILSHLLDNALKFTDHGSITVSLNQATNATTNIHYAQIAVKDTGIGIALEQLPYLFSQFPVVMHPDNSQFTYKYPGIGLGLIIIRQLINRMGGEIFVKSEVGKGSVFTFTLPISDAPTQPFETAQLRNQLAQLRCLIICDDLTRAELLREQLMTWGINCSKSALKEGLNILRKSHEDKLPFQFAIICAPTIDQHIAYYARTIRANASFAHLMLLFAPTTHLQNYEIEHAQSNGYTAILPYLQPTLFIKEIAHAWTNWPQKKLQNNIDAPIKKYQVLVVEDNNINQKVAKLLLTELNCQVDIVENGQTALQRLQKNRYDLVFMDIGLPDIDGLEVTHQLRLRENNKSHIPVIALTADCQLENENTWKELGVDDCLIKPYTMEQLETVINKWVKKS